MKNNAGTGERICSLDALRGLIMIVMALDHALFFIAKVHPLEYWGAPLPQYQNAFFFLARLCAHLCAPGFFFLMGVAMVLFAGSRLRQGWSKTRIGLHFFLRGLLLLFVQQFIVNPAWFLGTMGSTAILGNVGGGTAWFNLDVLYGLGGCMMILSPLVGANGVLIAILGVGAAVVGQMLMPAPEYAGAVYAPLVRMLLVPGQTGILLVLYPLLPWVGIAGLGMAFGTWIVRDRAGAFRRLPLIGIGCLVVFTVLRMLGIGDYHVPAGGDWVSFLNVTKYPPSLVFVLLTVGVDFLLLALLSRLDPLLARQGPVRVFGKSALFFYVLHLYLYACVGIAFPEGSGCGVTCAVWLAGLALLYPLCRWYGGFKAGTKADSIWRFF